MNLIALLCLCSILVALAFINKKLPFIFIFLQSFIFTYFDKGIIINGGQYIDILKLIQSLSYLFTIYTIQISLVGLVIKTRRAKIVAEVKVEKHQMTFNHIKNVFSYRNKDTTTLQMRC